MERLTEENVELRNLVAERRKFVKGTKQVPARNRYVNQPFANGS